MSSPKTVLITGASRGIGMLTAEALAHQGHTVFAGMRAPTTRNAAAVAALAQTAAKAPGTITTVELDVTDDASVTAAVAQVAAQADIDVLINNAGLMPVGISEAFTIEQAQALFDVNLYGLMRMNRAVLPAMRARNSGLVISLSSAAGRFGMPYFGLYCASKWAMEAYSEALHYELEPFGIESVLVEPSGHGTDLVTTAPAPNDPARLESYGDVAKGRERLLGMFKSVFDQNDASTDASNVAAKIADLVVMDAPRPVRTQVGHDMGVSAVNEATAPLQAALIDSLKPVYTGVTS